MNEEYSTPKKMSHIGDLFDRYKKRFKAPQASVEKVCIKIIKDVTNFDLKTDQVKYTVSTRTIYLQVPSILKTELKFHYKTILKNLEYELGKETTPKIIL